MSPVLCVTVLLFGVALKRDPAQSIAFYHELHEKAALAHLEQPALAHLEDQTNAHDPDSADGRSSACKAAS